MLNIMNLTKTNKLILAAITFAAVLALNSGRAHAATLTVGSGCTLNNAISSVNAGIGQASCGGSSYGTNDTINIPAGTQTLTADLPSFTAGTSVTVKGAGKASTTIDTNGHAGFAAHDQYTSYTFSNFKIENASPRAFDISGKNNAVSLSNVEVSNSGSGATFSGINVSVTDSYIHGSTPAVGPNGIGLEIYLKPTNSTDHTSATLSNNVISDNSGKWAGLYIEADTDTMAAMSVSIQNTSVVNNQGVDPAGGGEGGGAGVRLILQKNNAPLTLSINSTTVANNTITATVANSSNNPLNGTTTRIVGFQVGVVNLASQLNFTNVTSVNNSITNTIDNALSIAGFFGFGSNAQTTPAIVNTTVVGNSVTQTTDAPGMGPVPAFFLASIMIVNNVPTDISAGGSAQNSLIANNTYNGAKSSCRNDFNLALIGQSGTVDITPSDAGNNLSDDSNCTGFTHVSNLFSTLGPLQDNGGPVQTIALLPGSPAIAAGGVVLGISTDARGVARPSTNPSVGSYQYVLGDNTTSAAAGGTAAPNTGIGSASRAFNILIGVLGFGLLAYIFRKQQASN